MELQRLLSQLIEKARSIRFFVSKLHELRFPSKNPLRLACLIRDIAQAVEDATIARYQTAKASAESDDFQDQVKFSISVLRRLNEDLRFIERAATQHTPWSLVRPLENLGERVHPKSYFIIRPQWSYNYSLRERLSVYQEYVEKLLPEKKLNEVLNLVSDGHQENLYVLGFPYMDRLSVLMHTLFGHEIGHPIEKEYFSKQEKVGDFLPSLFESVVKECKVPGDRQKWDLFDLEKVSRMLGVVQELRRRALAEIICDLVNVNLFGPAALFATEEFALSRELDSFESDPPQYHYPPWRYRLRVILQEFSEEWVTRFLKEGDFKASLSQRFTEKLARIRALTDQNDDKTRLWGDAETRIAYESVEAALPKVRQFAEQRLKEKGLKRDDLIGTTNVHLLDRLESWVPPDAYVDGTGNEVVGDMRAVMNVGWLCWISRSDSLPDKLGDQTVINDYFEKIDALNRLVLKAIEYIDLRSNWDQYRRYGGN